MTKAFTKGDRVTVIQEWSRNGTTYVRNATVYSCGTKVMRLTCDLTGDEFGQDLIPVVAAPGTEGVRPLLEGEALAAEAQAVAVLVWNRQRASLDRLLQHYRSVGHRICVESIQRDIDAMKAANWITYEQGCRECDERMEREYGIKKNAG